jgi:hypothetical protein
MPIATHLFIVNASVPPEIEDDWNRWYNEVHLPEIGDCPGFGVFSKIAGHMPSRD